jgi:hypothetical protein
MTGIWRLANDERPSQLHHLRPSAMARSRRKSMAEAPEDRNDADQSKKAARFATTAEYKSIYAALIFAESNDLATKLLYAHCINAHDLSDVRLDVRQMLGCWTTAPTKRPPKPDFTLAEEMEGLVERHRSAEDKAAELDMDEDLDGQERVIAATDLLRKLLAACHAADRSLDWQAILELCEERSLVEPRWADLDDSARADSSAPVPSRPVAQDCLHCSGLTRPPSRPPQRRDFAAQSLAAHLQPNVLARATRSRNAGKKRGRGAPSCRRTCKQKGPHALARSRHAVEVR